MADAAFLTLSLPYLPTLLTLIGVIIVLWCIALPWAAISLLCTSLVIGQILRLPLPGQGGGLLLSDIATAIVLISSLVKVISSRYNPPSPGPGGVFLATLLFTPFLLWSLYGLLLHVPNIPLPDAAIAILYWIRLVSTILLLPTLLFLFQNVSLRRFAEKALLVATILLAITGIIQYIALPNINNLTAWDPHPDRLVGTWRDPNFLGAFFAMMLPLIFVLPNNANKSPMTRGVRGVLFSLGIAALLLTQSRGSLLALGLALILLSPFFIVGLFKHISIKKDQIVVITASSLCLLLLLLSLVFLLMPNRLTGLLTGDDTVRLRAASLKENWTLAEQSTLTGTGYNLYQFVAQEKGIINSFTQHSRAGTDNSFLTLWITTGLIGLLAFLFPFLFIMQRLIIHWLTEGRYIFFAAALSLLTLLIHANFVNSLLYSHLVITLMLIIALTLSRRD